MAAAPVHALAALMLCLVAGCGSSTDTNESAAEPTATTMSRQVAINTWYRTASPAVKQIDVSMRLAHGALGEHDFSDLRAACVEMHEATEELDSLLPTPDPRLTAEFEGAAENYGEASKLCMSVSLETPTDHLKEMSSHFTAGQAHMMAAFAIINAA